MAGSFAQCLEWRTSALVTKRWRLKVPTRGWGSISAPRAQPSSTCWWVFGSRTALGDPTRSGDVIHGGFAHLRRRLVNISSTGSMPSGLSRLPSVTKIIPRKASRLLVNTLAPHSGQKFRLEPASPLEGESHGANPSLNPLLAEYREFHRSGPGDGSTVAKNAMESASYEPIPYAS